MLTQFQTTESQTALLAACPRPRTLVASSPSATSVITMPALTAPSAWSRFAPISAAASARVSVLGAEAFGAVERPVAGYAAALPAPLARVRTDFATVGGNGKGSARRIGENGGADSTKQQNQKHLTPRREPVTWRPPH